MTKQTVGPTTDNQSNDALKRVRNLAAQFQLLAEMLPNAMVSFPLPEDRWNNWDKFFDWEKWTKDPWGNWSNWTRP